MNNDINKHLSEMIGAYFLSKNKETVVNMKRNIIRQFRFNVEENKILKEKAGLCCLTDSALIRLLILGYKPKPKPEKEFYIALRNISAIGNSINQIAAKANALGFIDVPRLYKELENLERLKDDLYKKYIKPDKDNDKWQ